MRYFYKYYQKAEIRNHINFLMNLFIADIQDHYYNQGKSISQLNPTERKLFFDILRSEARFR